MRQSVRMGRRVRHLRSRSGGLAGVLLGLALLAQGCTASPANSPSPGGTGAEASTTVARLVDIGGGRRMYLECRGSGSPTVVLVPGLATAADNWGRVTDPAGTLKPSESAVYPGVGTFTRVCSYDRPGTVRADGSPTPSTPVPQPTTPERDAADLHALLAAADVPGPFVFGGSSAGGPIVRAYAAAHPHNVVGLVLVDAESEFLRSALNAEQFDVFLRLNRQDGERRAARWKDAERQDPEVVFDQVRALPQLPEMPVILLSADTFDADAFRERLPDDAPADYPQVFWQAQRSAQNSLAMLFLGARHVTDTRSDHKVQNNRPRIVIDSLREVVKQAREAPKQ